MASTKAKPKAKATSAKAKAKPKAKATPARAKPRPKAKTKANPIKVAAKARKAKATSASAPSGSEVPKTLAKTFAGVRAFCEIEWMGGPRKLAAKVFDWSKVSAAEKDDLLNDTFCDGVIEDLMADAPSNAFRPFAIPFAYLAAFPTDDALADDGEWITQVDGLLIYDARDGSVHGVVIDGTAMFDDVKKVAPSIEKLGLQAVA